VRVRKKRDATLPEQLRTRGNVGCQVVAWKKRRNIRREKGGELSLWLLKGKLFQNSRRRGSEARKKGEEKGRTAKKKKITLSLNLTKNLETVRARKAGGLATEKKPIAAKWDTFCA